MNYTTGIKNYLLSIEYQYNDSNSIIGKICRIFRIGKTQLLHNIGAACIDKQAKTWDIELSDKEIQMTLCIIIRDNIRWKWCYDYINMTAIDKNGKLVIKCDPIVDTFANAHIEKMIQYKNAN